MNLKIKFKKAGRRTRTCAHLDLNRQEIVLRTPIRCQKECEEPYIKLLNHEFMHFILFKIVGWEADIKWDNICDKVTEYLPNCYC